MLPSMPIYGFTIVSIFTRSSHSQTQLKSKAGHREHGIALLINSAALDQRPPSISRQSTAAQAWVQVKPSVRLISSAFATASASVPHNPEHPKLVHAGCGVWCSQAAGQASTPRGGPKASTALDPALPNTQTARPKQKQAPRKNDSTKPSLQKVVPQATTHCCDQPREKGTLTRPRAAALLASACSDRATVAVGRATARRARAPASGSRHFAAESSSYHPQQ